MRALFESSHGRYLTSKLCDEDLNRPKQINFDESFGLSPTEHALKSQVKLDYI